MASYVHNSVMHLNFKYFLACIFNRISGTMYYSYCLLSVDHRVHLEIVCTHKWNSPGVLHLSVLKIPHAEVTSYGKYILKKKSESYMLFSVQ